MTWSNNSVGVLTSKILQFMFNQSHLEIAKTYILSLKKAKFVTEGSFNIEKNVIPLLKAYLINSISFDILVYKIPEKKRNYFV